MRVDELSPGEHEAHLSDGRVHRVVVPAGVGVAGVEEQELVAALVTLLHERDPDPPELIDVSEVFARDPTLRAELEVRLSDPEPGA